MENSFNQNRVYGWGELAQLYFPNISQKSATGQLLKWIRVSDKLMHDLEEAGWHPGLKYLTPRQRDYIVGTSENREEVKVIYKKREAQLSTLNFQLIKALPVSLPRPRPKEWTEFRERSFRRCSC